MSSGYYDPDGNSVEVSGAMFPVPAVGLRAWGKEDGSAAILSPAEARNIASKLERYAERAERMRAA